MRPIDDFNVRVFPLEKPDRFGDDGNGLFIDNQRIRLLRRLKIPKIHGGVSRVFSAEIIIQDGFGRVLPAEEADDADDRREDAHRGKRGRDRPSVLRDAGDALAHLLFVGGQGGGGQHRGRDAAQGGKREQRFAVGAALVLAEYGERAFVAGKLPVDLGKICREPDQRIEKVNDQAHGAQQGPHRIEVVDVCLFVDQHMAKLRLSPGRLRRDIDRRTKEPEKAGRGDRGRHIDAVFPAQKPARSAQDARKAQIRVKKPRGHARHTDIPAIAQKFGKRDALIEREKRAVLAAHGIVRVQRRICARYVARCEALAGLEGDCAGISVQRRGAELLRVDGDLAHILHGGQHGLRLRGEALRAEGD